MIVNVLELEELNIGSVVGIFHMDVEKGTDPYQVALKTDGNQWALGGKKDPWDDQTLFNSVTRGHSYLAPLWSAS
jgi:hypothetical protein